MTRFHEQMKKLRDDDEYGNIFPNDDWTLQDYKDIFWCINKGYLVQDLSRGTVFMINEEWEGDDIYAEEFLEEEENGWKNGIIPNCEKCGEKFADDGHNYNERDGDEICDDCDKEEEEDMNMDTPNYKQIKNARGEKWEEKDCPIEDNNDDCSRCGIILTNDDMYSETGKCEMCNLEEVEEEFNGCCADCDDEEKKECRDCKIEVKKHCELCCGYECEDEEEEYGAKILCNDCDYYISSEDFDAGNGRTMIDALDNGEYRCEVCNEKIVCVDCLRDFTNECDGRSSFDEIGKIQCENCFLKEEEYGAKILCNDGDYYISSKDFASWSW
jgi:hypothetical protein